MRKALYAHTFINRAHCYDCAKTSPEGRKVLRRSGRRKINIGLCSVERCSNPAVVKGICKAHYGVKWRLSKPKPQRVKPILSPICSVIGCDRKRKTKDGLCAAHYERRKAGSTLAGPIGKPGRPAHFAGVSPQAAVVWRNIEGRCTDPRTNKYEYYGGKGIRNLLTPYDVQFLWDRDGASQMARPSIDRKKSDQNYTLKNCRFLELSENVKRSWRNHKRARSAAMVRSWAQRNARRRGEARP